MKTNKHFLTSIDVLLFFTAGAMSLYLYSLGHNLAFISLLVISFFSLVAASLNHINRLGNYGDYLLMVLGTSFSLIVYLSATMHYVGSIWIIHILLFAYFFLGFERGLKWNTFFLAFFFLMHIYLYFYPLESFYDWNFIWSNFLSLIISYIALYMYGLNTEKIRAEKDKLTGELALSLQNVKKAQKQLVESEKMSALGSLVAGVAHEINTPVGMSLTGVTHIEHETKMIIKAVDENTLGKNALSEYLETVGKTAQSMHLTLRNAAQLVRSFKQVAVDQNTEEKRNFNVREYGDEILLSLHSTIKQTKLVVENNVDKNINIYSYAGIYSQILTNLIINSIVHGFDEGEEGKVVLQGYVKEDLLYLVYIENGKGMEEEVRLKMFDPFFTTRMGQGGSGLGLNIIYNLIHHKLRGEIECESTLGEGMRVIITIPMKELE